jgi:lambda family phage portal protein
MNIAGAFLSLFSTFAPKASRQVTRREARADRARSLDAATGGRRARGMGVQPSLQADVHGLGPRVATRARYQAANMPLIASAVSSFVANVAGCGLRLVPRSGDDVLDAQIAASFESWSDNADFLGVASFYGLQAVLVERFFVDGEAWVQLVFEGDELRIKLWDYAQVDSALFHELPNGGMIIAGVEIDVNGRIAAYHVYQDYFPGAPFLRGLEPSRVPAENVVHFYRVSAAGQIRGLSMLAPAVLRATEYDALVDAQVLRQRLGAMHCGYVASADGTLLADGATPGEVSMEPGVLQRLAPGESITWSDPPEIGAEANEFQRSIEREIGAGVGIPSFLITHDMSQVNFSSARVSIQEFRRKVEQIQDHLAFQVLRPVYRKWLSAEILSGRIDARFDDEKTFSIDGSRQRASLSIP